MSVKVEQAYNKDQILELYLTVAPFGGNIYGISTASEFYFAKEPKELTLAEAAVLAGIIQNPVYNSPTLSPDPEDGKRRAAIRKEYILGQLLDKKDDVNAQHRENVGDENAEDLITEEIIAEALAQEVKYKKGIVGRKPVAGHFIDYVQQILQDRNYKNEEEGFDITELQNGGYRIYTTLDLDMQKISEKDRA